jgi:glutamate N-acetyltransferase/amino-acid N-acetyltransferase
MTDAAQSFQSALNSLATELAQDIVRDGEGATKFVAIDVVGATSVAEADLVARTVAHSPLVKTALFASDPNWGRILAAIGRAGVEDLDVDAVSLTINGVLIAEHGARAENYTEQAGVVAMAPEDLLISIDLALGNETATIWTTDFSYDYVKINAEYRT